MAAAPRRTVSGIVDRKSFCLAITFAKPTIPNSSAVSMSLEYVVLGWYVIAEGFSFIT